jgi:hypothetical protein
MGISSGHTWLMFHAAEENGLVGRHSSAGLTSFASSGILLFDEETPVLSSSHEIKKYRRFDRLCKNQEEFR